MAARLGRKAILTWKLAQIAGVREKSASVSGDPVDVSDGASNGWRELLTEAGETAVEISVAGVTKSDVLFIDSLATDRSGAMSLTYPDGGVLSGTFVIGSYSAAEPYKDAATFEATFQSSGVVTYTPAP